MVSWIVEAAVKWAVGWIIGAILKVKLADNRTNNLAANLGSRRASARLDFLRFRRSLSPLTFSAEPLVILPPKSVYVLFQS